MEKIRCCLCCVSTLLGRPVDNVNENLFLKRIWSIREFNKPIFKLRGWSWRGRSFSPIWFSVVKPMFFFLSPLIQPEFIERRVGHTPPLLGDWFSSISYSLSHWHSYSLSLSLFLFCRSNPTAWWNTSKLILFCWYSISYFNVIGLLWSFCVWRVDNISAQLQQAKGIKRVDNNNVVVIVVVDSSLRDYDDRQLLDDWRLFIESNHR